MKSLRWFVAGFAIAIITFATYLLVTRQQTYPTEIVESSAIAMIDFSQVPPDVLSFLNKLRGNQVVGHNTSEFPRLWHNTITNVEEDRKDNIVWYSFTLPMNAEQIEENNKAKEQAGAVPCWPMLGVRVDLELSIIIKAAIYTQCL